MLKPPTGSKCRVAQTESAKRVQTKERSVWAGYQKSIREDFMVEVRLVPAWTDGRKDGGTQRDKSGLQTRAT